MSAITSSQLTDTENIEITLDGEEIELMIDIGMVLYFIALLLYI